jgi:hypothetical protein
MKALLCALLCCLALSEAIAGRSSSSSNDFGFSTKKSKKKTYTPPPTPTPPPAPSVDLSNFISAHGEQIFAPYDAQSLGKMPKPELAQLRASFAERFGKAGLAERQQYQLALSVCDGLTQVMAEKSSPTSVPTWPQRSAQLRQWIDQLMAQEKTAEASAPAPSPAH